MAKTKPSKGAGSSCVPPKTLVFASGKQPPQLLLWLKHHHPKVAENMIFLKHLLEIDTPGMSQEKIAEGLATQVEIIQKLAPVHQVMFVSNGFSTVHADHVRGLAQYKELGFVHTTTDLRLVDQPKGLILSCVDYRLNEARECLRMRPGHGESWHITVPGSCKDLSDGCAESRFHIQESVRVGIEEKDVRHFWVLKHRNCLRFSDNLRGIEEMQARFNLAQQGFEILQDAIPKLRHIRASFGFGSLPSGHEGDMGGYSLEPLVPAALPASKQNRVKSRAVQAA